MLVYYNCYEGASMKSITLRRDSDHSILSELRRKGFSQHDFLDRIPARAMTSDVSAANVTKDILFQGKPMLYIDAEGGFVDAFPLVISFKVVQR